MVKLIKTVVLFRSTVYYKIKHLKSAEAAYIPTDGIRLLSPRISRLFGFGDGPSIGGTGCEGGPPEVERVRGPSSAFACAGTRVAPNGLRPPKYDTLSSPLGRGSQRVIPDTVLRTTRLPGVGHPAL